MIVQPFGFLSSQEEAVPPGPARAYLSGSQLTDALYICSFNKLVEAYTGSCARFRRSSDDTEQDIGFDATGKLDESALSSFGGSDILYLTKWYSQVNATEIYNDYTASQATITTAGGTIRKLDGKVVCLYSDLAGSTGGAGGSLINYTYSDDIYYTGTSYESYSVFHVLSRPASIERYSMAMNGGTGGGPAFIFDYNARVEWYNGNSERHIVDNSDFSTGALSLLSATRGPGAGSLDLFYNGTEVQSNKNITNLGSDGSLRLFMANNNDGTNAYCAEFLLYKSNKTSDVASINSNITTYYGL